ncbi:hypothetical protein PHYSODRAFT_265377 [Phytophthora sojae]|uniref:RxLR effector protein n=1 Tax=Phytophthora sojae (strain P6497) TaxID=1094619 RepID=G4ZME9_PHYSP|nr:hypothetical protein PHYSODRAFT_265377 [Phytophthora sojae]EGZ15002.1 hypothetical protein PHYSODRAFT_265377 [Phytophthora sojae]|eukprot:XP_009528751.1 hypothetical protein PHYSODRAFT_265377 [Phytophthora sojae]
MCPKSTALLLAATLLACSAATATKLTFVDLAASEAVDNDDDERGVLDAVAGLIKAGAPKVIDTTKLHT